VTFTCPRPIAFIVARKNVAAKPGFDGMGCISTSVWVHRSKGKDGAAGSLRTELSAARPSRAETNDITGTRNWPMSRPACTCSPVLRLSLDRAFPVQPRYDRSDVIGDRRGLRVIAGGHDEDATGR
jgi:hypothetical protein